MVILLFPELDLQKEDFYQGKKRQKLVHKFVKELFPGSKTIFDYKHPKMRFRSSGRKMELDIFIPTLRIAFEYNGEQHYLPREQYGGKKELKNIQARDREKRIKCKEKKIRLIVIKYTWSGSKRALEAEIERQLGTVPWVCRST